MSRQRLVKFLSLKNKQANEKTNHNNNNNGNGHNFYLLLKGEERKEVVKLTVQT